MITTSNLHLICQIFSEPPPNPDPRAGGQNHRGHGKGGQEYTHRDTQAVLVHAGWYHI